MGLHKGQKQKYKKNTVENGAKHWFKILTPNTVSNIENDLANSKRI